MSESKLRTQSMDFAVSIINLVKSHKGCNILTPFLPDQKAFVFLIIPSIKNGANNNIIDQSPIRWIKIDQVGRHSENSRMCFAAMQKILFSCHDAEKKQIIFLVNGNGKEVELDIPVYL